MTLSCLNNTHSPKNFTVILPFHLDCAYVMYMTLNPNSSTPLNCSYVWMLKNFRSCYLKGLYSFELLSGDCWHDSKTKLLLLFNIWTPC